MFFNTSKILDRATERNKTQKYVEIIVKGPEPQFVRLLERSYSNGKLSWRKWLATDDKVKMPSYPIKKIVESYTLIEPDNCTLEFSEEEIKFHKFAEDHNLSWTIIPTNERIQNPDEYFDDSWSCTIGRTDLIMRNFLTI